MFKRNRDKPLDLPRLTEYRDSLRNEILTFPSYPYIYIGGKTDGAETVSLELDVKELNTCPCYFIFV